MKLKKAEVQKFLQKHTNKEIKGVIPVGKGEWSQAFFYQEGDFRKVIRFSEVDEDFRRDQFAYGLASQKLPVPKIEEIGKVFGGFFAISEKFDGEMIDNLGPAEMRKLIPSLLALFNSLRLVDTSKTTGFGGWSPEGNGARNSWKEFLVNINTDSPSGRISGWKEKLAKNKDFFGIFNRAYQEMLEMVDFCSEVRYVAHNDLLHFNLLVKGGKIVALLDWGCALYGDFLYDLAMFTAWQFYYPSMRGINWPKEAKTYFKKKGVDLSHFDQRLKCYQLHLLLDSMAYNSFRENWKDVEMVTKRLTGMIK